MTTIHSLQAPGAVVMIRPHRFGLNAETAADNAFQARADELPGKIAATAFKEVTDAADRLRSEGVRVHLFEDQGDRETPDSVFPNNWFSTHPGGHVAIYPMFSPSRRRERRTDVIEMLKSEYRVQDIIDYSGLEEDKLFLEGTGAMVFDHLARVAYAARSKRANPVALERFCTHFQFEPMAFHTADATGRLIYHTNVLMCIGTEFALVGADAIQGVDRASEICSRLRQSGRDVIELSHAQVAEFAGNAMELTGRENRVVAMSSRAHRSLSADQRARIERTARIVPLDVPTIEMAGGSVRCMLAGIHLSPRQ